jgi:flagellar M-ring protein FliF
MSVAFLSLSIVLLLIVSVIASRPKMDVLYSGLAADDAGAVINKLQEQGIPYEISGNGSVIKVPSNKVAELKIAMAAQGLPQSGTVGFEIFDKNTFGMTEFSQRVQYQRAIQGELARTISQLDAVSAARVHITIPSPTVFKNEDSKPSASVVVKLRPGRDLETESVAGIVHLVASSVEGLRPENVTVVDTHGNVLSAAVRDATGLDPRLSASQLQLKSQYEQQLSKSIQSMLERIIGPNKAVVRVDARMNFDRRETTSEQFSPISQGRGILLSEEEETESYGEGTGRVGGVAGINVAGNIRPSVNQMTGGGSGYVRRRVNNRYEVSKTTEHIIKSPGTVEQLSVAVLIDDKVSPSKVMSIRSAVEAAVGADASRGDKVIVERIPFDNSLEKSMEKEMKAAAARETYMSIGKTLGALVLLAGFLFFLKRTLGQINLRLPEPSSQPVQVASLNQPQPKTEESSMGSGTTFADSTANPVSATSLLQGASQRTPEEVAEVIKTWISRS